MGSFQDLTGKRFGMLEVTGLAAKKPTRWHCRCDCGGASIAESRNLKNGSTKSCGCLRSAVGKANFKDLSGKRFGKLEVVSLHSRRPRTRWLCRCDCGSETVVRSSSLLRKTGATRSCGCMMMDEVKDLAGLRFGSWRVLSLHSRQPTRWHCRCDCGTERSVLAYNLKSGVSRSCGCSYERVRPCAGS